MAFTPRIEINGKIDTNQTVLSNINKIAASCQAYVTWDPSLGKFTTVLNRAGTSVWTFDDSNIIGSIVVSGTGIDGLYNSARVSFVSKDQRGEKDERVISIANEDRFAQELDNELGLSFDMINDPVQAELLAAIELKQSRVDKVIEFVTDYRAIGLKAGDIIGVANEVYFVRSSVNPKLFRILTIEETDGEDGGILLAITALEYDGNVYSTDNLTREERITESGIVPVGQNICIIEKESIAAGKRIGAALQTDEGRAAITGAGVPIFETGIVTWSAASVLATYGAGTGAGGVNQLASQLAPYYIGPNVLDNAARSNITALEATWFTNNTIKMLELDFAGPQGSVNYTINGRSSSYAGGIPTYVMLFYSQSPTGPWQLGEAKYMEWSSYTTSFQVADIDVAPVYWMLLAGNLVTYDLSETANITVNIDSVDAVYPAADGSGAGLALKLFLN